MYYVYIMSNQAHTLYIGMTNDLQRRVYEHKMKLVEGFTRKYNLTKLVYFETADHPDAAIEREKELKGWLRARKLVLIQSVNINFNDLSVDWDAE